MKKFVFTLFFVILFTAPALADYSVDQVSVSADVAANGRASVSTVIQLTFDTITEQVSIPLPEREVSRVSAGDFKFSTETTDEGVNVVVRRKDGFAGVQTFLISYTTPYAGSGDFSLGLLSSRWEKDIGSCDFQVILPKPLPGDPIFTGGYKSELSPDDVSYVSTETSFSGALGPLMAFDSLSVRLAVPEDYFTVRRATLPVVSVTFVTLIMAAVLALTAVYWRLRLRSPRGQIAPRLLPPEGILPHQLPLALDGATCDMAALMLEWANLGYVTLSQTRQGIPVLTKRMDMGSERSKAERRLFRRIFGQKRRVAATPGRFSGSAARFRNSTRRSVYRVILDRTGGNPVFVQLPCRLLLAVAVGYLGYRLLPEGGGFAVLAVLLGFVGLIYSLYLHSVSLAFAAHRTVSRTAVICWALMLVLLALSLLAGSLPEMLVGLTAVWFSAVATAPGPRRNQRGVDVTAQVKGLRTFYRRVTWQRLQVLHSQSTRFFQAQLPQAVALGVDRSLARRFERLSVPQPEWLDLPAAADHSALSLDNQLTPILRQLREAFR